MKIARDRFSLVAVIVMGLQSQALAQTDADHAVTYNGEVGQILNEN